MIISKTAGLSNDHVGILNCIPAKHPKLPIIVFFSLFSLHPPCVRQLSPLKQGDLENEEKQQSNLLQTCGKRYFWARNEFDKLEQRKDLSKFDPLPVTRYHAFGLMIRQINPSIAPCMQPTKMYLSEGSHMTETKSIRPSYSLIYAHSCGNLYLY